jgi:hypothetical protein
LLKKEKKRRRNEERKKDGRKKRKKRRVLPSARRTGPDVFLRGPSSRKTAVSPGFLGVGFLPKTGGRGGGAAMR